MLVGVCKWGVCVCASMQVHIWCMGAHIYGYTCEYIYVWTSLFSSGCVYLCVSACMWMFQTCNPMYQCSKMVEDLLSSHLWYIYRKDADVVMRQAQHSLYTCIAWMEWWVNGWINEWTKIGKNKESIGRNYGICERKERRNNVGWNDEGMNRTGRECKRHVKMAKRMLGWFNGLMDGWMKC